MSKRKGLSVEEKRNRMLEIFHASQDFFQLKELEKIAPKEKGITTQSVKDVVQNLVDDGLIDTDKIGTSVYFWSYPSQTLNVKKHKLIEISARATHVQNKLKITKELLAQQVGKQESGQRISLVKDIVELEEKERKLREKIQEHEDNDPELLSGMKESTKLLVMAVNRWTDNIYCTKSWCKKKFMIDATTLDKQFEIPSEMDYLIN